MIKDPSRPLFEQITFEANIIYKGNYSTVFPGFLNGQRIALKKIPLPDFNLRKDADVEEEVLRRCDHPNIVKLLRVEECTSYRLN
jgi:hypothetical protein